MILFAILGAFVGIFLSQFLIDVLLLLEQSFKIVIITFSTLLFFTLSLLLTAGTGKEVQEGYWKMAVLRKLTVISKKLDNLENLEKANPEQKTDSKEVVKEDLIENTESLKKSKNVPNKKEIAKLAKKTGG